VVRGFHQHAEKLIGSGVGGTMATREDAFEILTVAQKRLLVKLADEGQKSFNRRVQKPLEFLESLGYVTIDFLPHPGNGFTITVDITDLGLAITNKHWKAPAWAMPSKRRGIAV